MYFEILFFKIYTMGDPYTCDQYWPKKVFVDYIGYFHFIIALFDYKVQFARSFDNVCASCTTRTSNVHYLVVCRTQSTTTIKTQCKISPVILLCDHFYVLLKWYHHMVCFPSTSSWPLTLNGPGFFFWSQKKERVKSHLSLAFIIIAFWAEPKCFSRRTISD